MRGMKAFLAFVLAFLLCFSIAACSQTGDPDTGGDTGGTDQDGGHTDGDGNEGQDDEQKIYDLLLDTTFKNGFTVTADRSNLPDPYLGEVHYNQTEYSDAQWILGQWGSRYLITPDSVAAADEDGNWVYQTQSKTVKVNTQTGSLYMEALASEEYDHPRQNGEDWPHLLVEQTGIAEVSPWLNEMQSLTLSIDFVLEKAENKMGSDYNAGLHAAQFQWYVTLQNVNPASEDYGDMIWFGLQFYDNRVQWPEHSITVDGGKEDASGKAIYIVDSKKYLSAPVWEGDRTVVEYDILEDVQKALEEARAFTGVEVFHNTEFSDLKITSMNLGWELPGTFDVAVSIENFSIQYTLKNE